MATSLPTVFEFGANKLETITINDEPWFVAAQVCDALDIKNSRDAVALLDEDERRMSVQPTPSGRQKLWLVNESGVYALIFNSRKPDSKKYFRVWEREGKDGEYELIDLNFSSI